MNDLVQAISTMDLYKVEFVICFLHEEREGFRITKVKGWFAEGKCNTCFEQYAGYNLVWVDQYKEFTVFNGVYICIN